jgi:hypothetical protein
MMNIIYRIVLLLLVSGFAACTSTQSSLSIAGDDEDRDIGLGGTGMLASTGGTGSGLGGTGILGKVTGFGSVFVNGIEIEYDDKTIYTIDGKATVPQQLEIGDVVEVLTTDDERYTHAQIINLRHEVVGVVDSVDRDTYSFTVHGQSVIHAIDEVSPPEAGATVAVSGFRVNDKTILATRVKAVAPGQSLLRTDHSLPFGKKSTRWLVQAYVRGDKAEFELEGAVQRLELEQKTKMTMSDRLRVKILRLQKTSSGQLKLDRVVDEASIPLGRKAQLPVSKGGIENVPGAAPGSTPGVTKGPIPGSSQGSQSGPIQNLKR